MTTRRALAGVAHDIAHHAASGLSYLSPHMAQVLRTAGLNTTILELLDPNPYPPGVLEVGTLRLALRAFRSTVETILTKSGFALTDVTSIQLHATPAPWDESGYSLHTRAVITATDGRTFDSGWLQ
jgi:hypothetical protein